MRILAVMLMFFWSCGTAVAQHAYLGVTAGQYNMSDMKGILDASAANLIGQGIPVTKALNFPASLQLNAGLDWLKSNGRTIGVYSNYGRTAGKLAYSDYSGSFREDQELVRYVVGAKFSKTIRGRFGFYGKAGFNYTELYFTDALVITGSPEQKTTSTFTSLGGLAEPGIQYLRSFDKIYICLMAGYELNIQALGQAPAIVNWSGFRVSLIVAFDTVHKK